MGNDSSIDIWSDPWLPRSLSFKVLSSPPPLDSPYHQARLVSNLIDGATHSWNIPLVKSLFSVFDEESIISTPLARKEFMIKEYGIFLATVYSR